LFATLLVFLCFVDWFRFSIMMSLEFFFGILFGSFLSVLSALVAFHIWISKLDSKTTETTNLCNREQDFPFHSEKTKEQCQWFNALLERLVFEHLSCEPWKEKCKLRLSKFLKNVKRPDFVGPLKIDYLSFGNNRFELIDDIQLLESQNIGETKLGFTIKYHGNSPCEVLLTTDIHVTWRNCNFLSFPVSFRIRLQSLEGKVLFSIPSGTNPPCRLRFVSEPVSRFEITSLLPNRKNYLPNVAPIREYIIGIVQRSLRELLVEPNGLIIQLPVEGNDEEYQ